MKSLELIILILIIIVVFLLYKEFTRNTSVKIEGMNASEAGIEFDSTGIKFTKPVRFDGIVTANGVVTANNIQSNVISTNEIKKINDLKFDLLPQGTILAFNKEVAPFGWAICDGTQGTPDLRGRFILGSGQGSNLTNRILAATGGMEKVTLTVAEMPRHSHDLGFQNDDYNGCCGGIDSLENDGGNWRGRTTSETGESKPHENMPPFYVLTYIMKL